MLVVAGVALLSLGLWARFTIYDQDRFVSTVGELSTDPTVQRVAVERVMTEIDTQIAVRSAEQGLSPTVALTYQMLRSQIESGIISALSSPQFGSVWNAALRELHGPFTDLLKGHDTPNLRQTDSDVQVNLFPTYQLAQQSLPPAALQLLGQLEIDDDNLWITVLEGDTLSSIHQYVRLFNRALAVGIIVSVLSAVAYVLFSRRKLRAMAWVSAAIGIGLLIQRIVLQIGKQQLVDSLDDESQRGAARIFYDTLVGDLLTLELSGLAVAIVVAVAIFGIDEYLRRRAPAQTPAI